jgi:8-oxo-dGTP pyrophosphatase MutT (NUDIX family)
MTSQQEDSSWTYSDSVGQYDITGTEFLQKDQYRHYDHLVIGVSIFDDADDSQLLVVQRAATEDQFPNMFELPGGHVEASDKSILCTVVRETLEETSLRVSHIASTFEPLEYESKAASGVIRKTLQINFRVLVKDKAVIKLTPDEHQAYRWISLQDVGDLITTDAMRAVIKNAFGQGHTE